MRGCWSCLLGLVACGGTSPHPTAPPVDCIPLVAPDLGFTTPAGWRVERRDQGVWDFTLSDPVTRDQVAVVKSERFAKCTPAPSGEQRFGEPIPPLDPAFPEGYAVDETKGGSSGNEGAMVSDEACVRGDHGALYVVVYGHDAKYQPQVHALLVAFAEATDGKHACPVQR